MKRLSRRRLVKMLNEWLLLRRALGELTDIRGLIPEDDRPHFDKFIAMVYDLVREYENRFVRIGRDSPKIEW